MAAPGPGSAPPGIGMSFQMWDTRGWSFLPTAVHQEGIIEVRRHIDYYTPASPLLGLLLSPHTRPVARVSHSEGAGRECKRCGSIEEDRAHALATFAPLIT
jgi:hypothetical protein